MDFLFRSKSKTKSPTEVVSGCRQNLLRLDNAIQRKTATEEITRALQQMKLIYFGDAENLPNADLTSQLAQQVYLSDLLPLFITNLAQLEFEAKKDVVSLFNSLLRRHIADRLTTVEYLMTKEPTILLLSRSYVNPETALHCGQILRECLKHEQLSRILLQSPSIGPIREPEIWNYFPYIETSTFEVASDAFSTFKILLTLHKHQSTEFLQANYDRFFEQYTKLLTSNNYVWKRQSLKLLGEILLDRINYNVMSVYIQNTENLKLMMNLLRDRSAHIQFEAFHVFKVFVANPHKEQGIKDILTKNQARLLVFLQEFHNDRQEDDEQFADEKRFIIEQIRAL